MTNLNKYVIGVDFGTDSCRVLIVDAVDGDEVATSVKYYPRWSENKFCNSRTNQYRQHPLDYLETLELVVKEALSDLSAKVKDNIVGISFATTGSTPVLTDRHGTPLSLLEDFADNPNAMFILWKDHTSIEEATEINSLINRWKIDYTAYEGGVYSSEWVWAKVLHVLRQDKKVRATAYSWVEHCDWISGLLAGKTTPETMFRSRCAAGHKAMWHPSWDGLPSEEFLSTLDPLLSGFRSRLFSETYPGNTVIGNVTDEWAKKLGINTNVVVAVGAFDCHMGAVGAHIRSNVLVKSIGTSTCDIIVATEEELKGKLIPEICGQVESSVIPGMIGLEAGQSAYGDLFAWFKQILEWPIKNIVEKSELLNETTKQQLIESTRNNLLIELTKEAEKIPISESSIIATDWFNGRRTPYANQSVKATITGLTLGSTAPTIFRALVEAAAFGAKAIVDHFTDNGIKIDEIIAIGGISYKSPFVMQVLSNVLGIPIKIAKSEQCCALGAAMFAAVAANIYSNVETAQRAMGKGYSVTYYPDEEVHQIYKKLYLKYGEIAIFSEFEI